MNSGWMKKGWIFLYLFLSIKKDEFQGMFFICLWGVNFWWRMDDFKICFSSVYGVWISDKEWMNFKVCFSSVYGGINFWWRMDEFQGIFFICLQGMNLWQIMVEFHGMFFIRLQCVIFDGRWMNFKIFFSSVYRLYNFHWLILTSKFIYGGNCNNKLYHKTS